MLYLLSKFQKRLRIKLSAFHINHKLRGKSADEDELFCEEFCSNHQIDFSSVSKNIKSVSVKNKISIEESGRNIRYKELQKRLRQIKFDKIATAHNANDNTETVLLNLIKGTGIDGISGIPVVRQNIIRPVSSFTKEEILDYLERHKISVQN